MKKILLAAVCCLIALSASSCAVSSPASPASPQSSSEIIGEVFKQFNESKGNAIASVNGDQIFESDVSLKKFFNEYANKINADEIEKMPLSEDEKASMRQKIADNEKSDSQILDEIIQSKVILLEAEKLGITVDDSFALDAVESTYKSIEQNLQSSDPEQKSAAERGYALFRSFADAYGISIEEYLVTYSAPIYKNILIKEKVFENFKQTLSENDMPNSSDLFIKHINELMSQYEIVKY